MSTIHLTLRYRPIRVGWCVREGNPDDLRRALRLTSTLWGGRYNPVIPVEDAERATSIVEAFHVDVLYPICEDERVKAFIKKFKHLPWPLHYDLFVEGYPDKEKTNASLLDIYHPIRHLNEEYIRKHPEPLVSVVLYDWTPADPIGDVLLASFGAYPSREEIGKDYKAFAIKYLAGRTATLDERTPVEGEAYKLLTPIQLSEYDLISYGSGTSGKNPGFYIGSVLSLVDVINFWNLRAAGIELVFWDPAFASRLCLQRDQYLAFLREKFPPESEWPDCISVWSNSGDDNIDLSAFGPNLMRCAVTSPRHKEFSIESTPMHFKQKSIVASVDETGFGPSVSFQLPEKPFFDETSLHTQHLVFSVSPLVDISREDMTFLTPFLPELNEYYGRNYHFIWNSTRVERDSIGIIDSVTTYNITLHALPARELISKVFDSFGMNTQPSAAGLIGARLIQQMGGMDGCRVFKIEGVRELIEKYSPSQSFTRSAAIMTIGRVDPATGQPNFEAYENLYLEPRKGGKLKPEDAFNYLVHKGVFRAGLKLKCPKCELEFWLSLDDMATMATCEYCGDHFNVTPQLRDRDWAYRRSGLFGREGYQEGSIPVALALQQLEKCLHLHKIIYTTGINITHKGGKCESDLAVVSKDHDGHVQLTIGECKTRKEILEDDITNLIKVADEFPMKRVKVYLLFAKTAQFTDAEIERFRMASKKYRHSMILLSKDELEPYFLYERAKKKLGADIHAISLEDMVQASHRIYLG